MVTARPQATTFWREACRQRYPFCETKNGIGRQRGDDDRKRDKRDVIRPNERKLWIYAAVEESPVVSE